ncbi:telomere-binding protein cav isoform X2 [Drosophila kikkawai]|uniref:Telomere-binding protein cav isoform X2 n=1 Tax=Drosophila kikkawai TaxID=30033 RepID=A0ABM4GKJ1_DROKI
MPLCQCFMEMARTALSFHLVKYLKEEEQMVLANTDDSNRDAVMTMYNKAKITVNDMQREFTPEEKRMLCETTKVRVNMHKMNFVWDVKQRFDKKKRLENKSESFVNRMFVKAYKRRMFPLYTDQEIERYKAIAAAQTKKDNIVRVKIWRRSNGLDESSESSINISSSSSSDSESENMPLLFIESDRATLESQLQSQSDESIMAQFLPPGVQPPASLPPICTESGLVFLESQSQSQSDESTIAQLIPPVIQSPDRKPLSDFEREQCMGIGDQDEVDNSDVRAEPPTAVAERNVHSLDWMELANDINSESLSMRTILPSQNTEPEPLTDYECFGTQVVAASTQDSESFL